VIRLLGRVLALLAAVGALALVYVHGFRPWMHHWGATYTEVQKYVVGDNQWPDAAQRETRAITIHAPVDKVWPWLALLGQEGAYYSADWIDGVDEADERPTERGRAGLPTRAVGETLWTSPFAPIHPADYAIFTIVRPGEALVVATYDKEAPERPTGSLAFTIEANGATETRLLVRGRSGHRDEPPSPNRSLFSLFLGEPKHFAMERNMLIGLKQRAEGTEVAPLGKALEGMIWILICGTLLVSAVLTLIRRPFVRSYTTFVAAGSAFVAVPLLTPSVPVSLAVAFTLVLCVIWSLAAK